MTFNMYMCINRHPSGSTLNRRVENKAFINTITILYYAYIYTCVNVIILVTDRYKIVFLFFNHSFCLADEIIYLFVYSACQYQQHNINTVIKRTPIERSYFYVSMYTFYNENSKRFILYCRAVLMSQYTHIKRCYR